MKLKKKKEYISFLCIQCTILMKNNDLGMGSHERKGELSGGRAVSGLAPLKELSVWSHGSLRNHRRNILVSARWFRL